MEYVWNDTDGILSEEPSVRQLIGPTSLKALDAKAAIFHEDYLARTLEQEGSRGQLDKAQLEALFGSTLVLIKNELYLAYLEADLAGTEEEFREWFRQDFGFPMRPNPGLLDVFAERVRSRTSKPVTVTDGMREAHRLFERVAALAHIEYLASHDSTLQRETGRSTFFGTRPMHITPPAPESESAPPKAAGPAPTPSVREKNAYAIASLILGVSCIVPWEPFPILPVLAVASGIAGLAVASSQRGSGRIPSWIGIVLGTLFLIVLAIRP